VVTNSLPILNVTPPTATACVFSGVTFTASGANTYTWSNNVNTSTTTVFQSVNTNYTVSGSNAAGCVASSTVGVVALPLPVISVSSSFSMVCPSSSISYTASGASTYTWSNAASGSVVVFTPTASTQYSVGGTDAFGCASGTVFTALTYALPSITIAPSSASVCALSSISLSASGVPGFTWSTGSNNASVVVTPSVTTIYTVSGTDPLTGCVGSQTANVTAYALPSVSVAQTASAVCLGSEASFTLSGATTYTWSNGHLGNIYTFVPTSSTVFTVAATNTLSCTANKTVGIGVNALPVVTILPANSVTICVNEVATFTASGGVSYAWTPGTTTGPIFTVAPVFSPSSYSVTVTDNNNCSATASLNVRLNTCTGVNEQSSGLEGLVSVYPNPSNGIFTVAMEFDGNKNLQVINALGQVVQELNTLNRDEKINILDLAKGIYFVQIKSDKGLGKYKVVFE
jgi:hypothetical protein